MRRWLHRVTRLTKASRASAEFPPRVTRAEATPDAIGPVRTEGLDPGRAEPLLTAWAHGEMTDARLEQASLRLLGDRSLGPRADYTPGS